MAPQSHYTNSTQGTWMASYAQGFKKGLQMMPLWRGGARDGQLGRGLLSRAGVWTLSKHWNPLRSGAQKISSPSGFLL